MEWSEAIKRLTALKRTIDSPQTYYYFQAWRCASFDDHFWLSAVPKRQLQKFRSNMENSHLLEEEKDEEGFPTRSN